MQWGRNYKLSVGDSEGGWEIWDLNIGFDVTRKSGEKDSKSSATVSITNLSKEKIRYFQKKYINLELAVGYYGTGLYTLITGQVTSVDTKRSGGDITTTLTVSESFTELNHKIISKLVPDGRKVKDVIDEVISDMPSISKAQYTGEAVETPVMDGYPINATGREVLDDLSKSYKFEYTIDRGVLYTSDYDKPTNTSGEAILVNSDTGLINDPEEKDYADGKRNADKENRKGIKFTTLLNPVMTVGKLVKTQSTSFSGVYKLTEIRYYGEYMGNDWYCDCIAVETNYE